MFKRIILFIMIVGVSSLYAESLLGDNLGVFHKPKDGYTRYVIRVPKLINENEYRVELLIGKNMHLDSCNEYRLDGEVEDRGSYIEVKRIGALKTLSDRECQGKKEDRFIFLSTSDTLWKNYNSQSPIVIYLPKWHEVRYIVWKKHKNLKIAIER